MYSKSEASQIRQEFWTTFGKYMRPVLSAEDVRINWINYHTGIKDLFFRMDADSRSAQIAISIEHQDDTMRSLYFEQFQNVRIMLESFVGEEWVWKSNDEVNGKPCSTIYKLMSGVSVFNRSDWHQIISFLKPRIVSLDAFWSNAKYSFEDASSF